MQYLFDHRKSQVYLKSRDDIDASGIPLHWKHPSTKVALLGTKDHWSQNFHVEHEGTITSVKDKVLPEFHPVIKNVSPFFVWHANTALPSIHAPEVELFSYQTSPVSEVRARGGALVDEHLARAEKDLQETFQRAIDVLCRHYLKAYGEGPKFVLALVTTKPWVLDVDAEGVATLRDGKVEWDRECCLGHMAGLRLALVACDYLPDNSDSDPQPDRPYSEGFGLVPTERKVTKDLDFSGTMAESYERRVVKFPEWWSAIHAGHEAGHGLYPWDDPKARQLGFGNHDRAETLMCPLTSLKRGIYDVREGEVTLPGVGEGGIKAEALHEALKTNTGRLALITGVL